jgi:hypothetical protein
MDLASHTAGTSKSGVDGRVFGVILVLATVVGAAVTWFAGGVISLKLPRHVSPHHAQQRQWLRSAFISSDLFIFERPSMPISPARLRRSSTVQSS